MIRITQLKLAPNESTDLLDGQIRRALHLRGQEHYSWKIARQSIDARKKPRIQFVYTVDVTCEHESSVMKRLKNARNVSTFVDSPYRFPIDRVPRWQEDVDDCRPIITGSGPAGLFCALMLARCGARPIILERGDEADRRTETVERFWEGGPLDPESNVQFGEGGAGTFSDGKLNTGIRDPGGRILFVLNEFVKAGADPDILYSYRPHIGTDVLKTVVRNMRRETESLGGRFLFRTRLTGIQEDGPLVTVTVQNPDRSFSLLQTKALVLATGHSARDTFQMLAQERMAMEPKPFAVGVRVQHPQAWIDEAMYGTDCPYELPPSPYKLAGRSAGGRGVYSFCMCPGGYIVNASSEPGRLCVNGMSYHDRGSGSANSAIVVTVSPEDYGSCVLSGIEFQRRLEERAYRAGNGCIPVQRLEDFRLGRPTTAFGTIRPVMKGKGVPGSVRNIFPEPLAQAIDEGMQDFGRKIPGFDHPDVLLCGVESRTSSPVRILRGESGESLSHPGIYPCGEGAGYAGGITSAAVDGIRIAEKVAEKLENEKQTAHKEVSD